MQCFLCKGKPYQRYPLKKQLITHPGCAICQKNRFLSRLSSSCGNNGGCEWNMTYNGPLDQISGLSSYPGHGNQLSSVLSPPLVVVALPFDLPDERKENRLMRRREKLPDFLRLLVAVGTQLLLRLEMSSWDTLTQGSFSRCRRRNNSFVPLCRKPTGGRRAIKSINHLNLCTSLYDK